MKKLNLLAVLVAALFLVCSHTQQEVGKVTKPQEGNFTVTFDFLETEDPEIRKLAPSKANYMAAKEKEKEKGKDKAKAHHQNQNETGMRHEQCGDTVDVVMDSVDKLAKAAATEPGLCYYSLRTVTPFVTTRYKTLTKVSEYVDSGVIEKQFYPFWLPTETTGGGVYRKTSGTATGANGIVKFRIDGTNQFLIAYFENSWSTKWLAAACIFNEDWDDETIYDQVYDASSDYAHLYRNYWPNSISQCIGVNFQRERQFKATFTMFGQTVSLGATYSQTPLTIQKCRLESISILLE